MMLFRELMFCVLTGIAVVLNASTGVRVISGVPYVAGGVKAQCGDIHLPEKVSPSTPVVLLIHGGGWTSMSRHDVEGIAEFFVNDLGFAVYNIDYRLASVKNRWPACGDDCVTAAKWLLSSAFTEISGIKAGKIWICGGSAGGHLALWTLVNMPSEKVAGAVSISSIGDPAPDFAVHSRRYRHLFGTKVTVADLAAMNPVLKIRPGTAPVLCTHATGDKVVPVSSHRMFADAYRAAGNVCEFFEYSRGIRKRLSGHCIWIPDTKPRRLLGQIENRIRRFVGGSSSQGAVKVSERFGFDPVDATRHIQAALDSGLPEIVIDAQKSPWVVRPLFVRIGQRIVFEKGTVLQAKRGAFKGRNECLLTIRDCGDVEIVGNGALLRMWRDDYARGEGYRRGEWRHTLAIKGGERITVTGLRIEESGGDGIYISKGQIKAKDIVIRDCVCDRHHRQGLSIISGENILVENCVFKNTRGTPPEDGIDIEPNDADDHCVNIVIRNCVSENNTGKGFEAALTHLRAGTPVSIRFENCRSIGDRFGVKVRTRVHPTKGDYPTGSVVFDRCSFSRTKNEAITVQQVPEKAYEVRFDDCSFERIGEQAYDAPLAVLVSLFADDPRPAMPKMTNMHWPDRGDRPLYRYDGMNFAAFGVETLPLKQLDLGSVRVADSSPGKFVAFPPMSIRSRALCHVYADSARDIRIAARQIRCGETETGEGTVDILTARGKKIGSCVLPVSDGTNIVFRAPAAGFYSLAFNVGKKNAVALTGSDAPIAVDTRRLKPQRAMKSEVVSVSGADGSFFVPMVSGERAEFRIQGAPPGMYEGAPQRVSVSVIDPSGNAVYSHPAVLYAEHFLTPPASEDGIWELRLKCAGDGKNGNSYYEIAGVSPLLFLTKEKVWYSNLKKGTVK